MQELKVKNVIIGKQFDDSENLQKFIELVKQKKINVSVVEAGMQINVEKNLYFDVIWPDSNTVIEENSINNNALVCKLNYKNFNMLFTGDIEEEAEQKIIEMHSSSSIRAQVLKVGHHGSKSSSIKEFLELVNPKIALIGVGANNKYGHPNNEVIERLKVLNCDIYRTDEMGEISLKINSNGEIKKVKQEICD